MHRVSSSGFYACALQTNYHRRIRNSPHAVLDHLDNSQGGKVLYHGCIICSSITIKNFKKCILKSLKNVY